ncbi:MAG: response regulator [Gammaproteobacteria bacterium]|nr:response regulator [Gammaproteobacteria bacterium]
MQSIQISQLFVLIVEPSTTQQRIVSGWLEDMGVRQINVVAGGEDALQQMRATPPDLVISAMHLPGMTGTDLVQLMRNDPELADIPFMLVSSETSYRYLEPLRQAGVIAILPKPFTPEQLQKSLYATLDFLEPNQLHLGDHTPDEIRVLLVDDMHTSRRFMRQILEKMGIVHVQEAENGMQARELIDREYFDLIITDYYMPEMDGGELIDYIRNESSQGGVPILMVTSASDRSRLAAIEQNGVAAVFDKPFDVDTLRRIVEQTLS